MKWAELEELLARTDCAAVVIPLAVHGIRRYRAGIIDGYGRTLLYVPPKGSPGAAKRALCRAVEVIRDAR